MAYRKFTADRIFDGYRFHEGATLVADEAGRILDLQEGVDEETPFYKGILLPGLVNSHCHLELSHLLGKIERGTGLVDFVLAVMRLRGEEEAVIQAAIAAADEAMFAEGIVAVGDICNTTATINKKAHSPLRYYNFIEATGWMPGLAPKRLQAAVDIAAAFQSMGLQPATLVPHAPYSVSPALWTLLQEHFKGRVVSIHNGETKEEDLFFLEGKGDFTRLYASMNLDNSHHVPPGLTSLQSYYSRMEEAGRILLVHNTFTGAEDLDYVRSCTAAAATFFCICIKANLYIENALPPIELLREKKMQIVLGTDSLASNNRLSLDEINTVREHFPAIPLHEILSWATINSARALQMDDALGSFEKGKKPGIVLWEDVEGRVERLL